MRQKAISLVLVFSMLFGTATGVTGTTLSAFAEDTSVEQVNGHSVRIVDEDALKKEIKIGETIKISVKTTDLKGVEDTYYDELEDQMIATYTTYKWTLSDSNVASLKVSDIEEATATITGVAAGSTDLEIVSTACKACEPKKITLTVIEDKPVTPPVEVKPEEKPVTELNALDVKQFEPAMAEAVEAMFTRYRNPVFYDSSYSSGKYTGLLALSLRQANFNIDDINAKKNLFPTSASQRDLYNNARNIMTQIGANVNPASEVNKILDPSFKFYENLDKDRAKDLAFAVIALDLAKASYESDNATKALLNLLSKSDEGAYWIESYECIDMEATANCLIALSKHQEVEGVTEAIKGLKKSIKAQQSKTGFIKTVNSWGSSDSTLVTASVIQAIMALGENPLGSEWLVVDDAGEVNNLLEAILSCRNKDRFSEIPGGTVSDLQTNAALGAFSDLLKGNSLFQVIEYIKPGEPETVKINVPAITDVVEGDRVTLSASIYDKTGAPIRDAALIWTSEDSSVASVEKGVVQTLNAGEASVKVEVAGYPAVSDTIKIAVKSGISKEVLEAKLDTEIDFLKKHYEAYNQYEFVGALAATAAGMDVAPIRARLTRTSVHTSSFHYAKSIISAQGCGLNPRDIRINRRDKIDMNAVDILCASQVKQGKYKGQFIVNNANDADQMEYLAYSMIALDMMKASYDQDAAVAALLKLYRAPDFKNKYESDVVKIEGIAITALAKYKNEPAVKNAVDEMIAHIRSEQNSEGGFGSKVSPNCPLATGIVIQGLVENGINPLYSKLWVKDKKTVLDALMQFKYIKPNDSKNSGYSAFLGGGEAYQVTYHVFAAYTALRQEQSLFVKYTMADTPMVSIGAPKTLQLQKVENPLVILEGHKVQIQPNVFDEKMNLIQDAKIVWTSSKPEIASVNNGLVIGSKEGKAVITATVEGTAIKDSIDFSIEPSGVSAVKSCFKKDMIRIGDQWALDAIALDKTNKEVADQEFTWSTSNEQVLKIADEGSAVTVVGVGSGECKLKVALKDRPDVFKEFKVICVEKKTVQVTVRVEGPNQTVVPDLKLAIDNYDMASYSKLDCVINREPVAMNALIRALEFMKMDCTKKENFDAGAELGLVENIGGLKNFSKGQNSGWMYYVNDQYVPVNFIDKVLQEGDRICVFYAEDYTKMTYAYFNQQELVVKSAEPTTLSLKGRSNAGGDVTISQATIEVRDASGNVVKGTEQLKTDYAGNCVLTLEKPGIYSLSASRVENGINVISRPYCKVEVLDQSAEKPFKLVQSLLEKSGKESLLTLTLELKNIYKVSNRCEVEVVFYNEQGESVSRATLTKQVGPEALVKLISDFSYDNFTKGTVKVFVSGQEIKSLEIK